MRRTYQALAIVAALVIVAAALDTPYLQVYVVDHIFSSMRFPSSQSMIRTGELVRLVVAAIWETFWLLVTVTLTLACVAAALSRRTRWLVALIVTGLVAIYWPFILDGPILGFAPPINLVFGFSSGVYWLPTIMPVVATSLTLIFALTGMRQAEAPRVAVQA